MSEPTSTRLYIRDAKYQRWHEVERAGANNVTTFCGREYREESYRSAAPLYDRRTSWPPHRFPRCRNCMNKALKSR